MRVQRFNSHGQSALKKNREDNSKPIEDVLISDNKNKIFIVCDGVTRSLVNGVYPNPSPAAKASVIFAETVHSTLINLSPITTPKISLHKAIKCGNDAVREFNISTFPKIDYVENDFAGTIAIVTIIKNDKFYYAYNGDCCGYLLTENGMSMFTTPQTTQVSIYREKFGFGRDATITIRRDIRNNKQHPLGYGVYTGESSAMDFVEHGSLQLRAGQKILIASDGISYLLKTSTNTLYGSTPESIILEAEILEDKLGIRSDDKAVIIIDTEVS